MDVADPKAFLSAAITIFAETSIEIMDKAVFEIAKRSDRPTLKTISQVMAELNEQAVERQQIAQRLPPPPPRPPRTAEEQARADRLVVETRRAFGLPEEGRTRISGRSKHAAVDLG